MRFVITNENGLYLSWDNQTCIGDDVKKAYKFSSVDEARDEILRNIRYKVIPLGTYNIVSLYMVK